MSAVDAPNLELDIAQLVDWLELVSLFNEFGVARLDALTSSLDQLAEEDEGNIAEADKAVEDLISQIEDEIECRARHLGETYPFRLGDDAEELQLVENWGDVKYCFYLVCLVTSHVTKSPILTKPPEGTLLNQLRNQIFQVLSTLALAGLAGGSAVTVGWPRKSGETVQVLMRRAAAAGAGFGVRDPIGIYVAPAEKDGGVDVIAWTGEISPPPSNLYFGQTASGNNWEGKPVADYARTFEENYLQDVMVGNRGYATIIPFRVRDERTWMTQHRMHRTLIDRLRLPPHALSGLRRYEAGAVVDEAEHVERVVEWLQTYRASALAS